MKSSDPAVSVVMAVHNGEPYLAAAIESVLAQTFRDFEFVIIDDCSSDRTADIVRGYGDARIIYRRNDENIGQTRSLNLGIALARAPFIARIDADDLFFPGKLERQMAFLSAHPDVAVLGTASRVIDEENRDIGLVTRPTDPKEILFRLCSGVPVVHISVVMRTAVLRSIGGFDAQYRYSQDYALWSEFVRAGHRITNLPEPLAAFRERADSVNSVNKLGAASDETCRITQRNSRDFASVELSIAECRALDLLMFPAANLDMDQVIGAYRNFKRIAQGIWERIPVKIRLSLMARLVWAIWKKLEHARLSGGTSSDRRVLRVARHHLRYPDVAISVATAHGLAGIGAARVGRIKAMATRYLLR